MISYDQAVDQLFATGYPQALERYLTTFGTSPVGMRFAGSSADDAAARYIAEQLEACGFVNVRLEPVPIDVLESHGARGTSCGRDHGGVDPRRCPAHAGRRHHGTCRLVRAGTAADFAAADDVTGKIDLIDAVLSSWWMDLPWREATFHGAVGIIYTSARGGDAYFADPAVLGSFDAEYNFANVPVVFLSGIDGMWLEDQVMANGTVTAPPWPTKSSGATA